MATSSQTVIAEQNNTRLGPSITSDGVHLRVWAPLSQRVEVVLQTGEAYPLHRTDNGHFTTLLPSARSGDRYKFVLDGEGPFPDPASRFQPDGPNGWSEIVDEAAYRWGAREHLRKGLALPGQVIYELHIGTFTAEGTYRAAEQEFQRLHDLGITILELMPLAEFSGRFGWGYDGVNLFAPFHHYGSPHDLRHMIETAHDIGLAVVLDVVYNHFGPEGNYIPRFSPYFFSKHGTEWGDSINFDEACSGPVRDFFIQNAEYWIRDFHFDGLRLDATQSIHDCGSHGQHILADIAEAARSAAGKRQIVLLSECERQECRQVESPCKGGFGLDGMWNDDLHHSAVVRLTGRREAYYTDHYGKAQEFISAAKWGFLFQGQFYSWQHAPRGTSAMNVEPWHMITFLENHDQVANTAFGTRPRALSSPGKYRAMAAFWLLMAGTPMFFMGQEFGSTRPFLYFADHEDKALLQEVRKGREEFLNQFDSIRTSEIGRLLPDPGKPATFEICKLRSHDRDTREAHQLQRFFTDLLRLRRQDPAIRIQRKGVIDGAVLTDDCFVLRYFLNKPDAKDGDDKGHGNDGDLDRLLVVNFGPTLELIHIPEPLLAPPRDNDWTCSWTSELPEYGGNGAAIPITHHGWTIGAEMAMLLVPKPKTDPEM